MRIIRSIHEVPEPKGCRGVVPTMGAFHEGHLDLMRRAREECDEVIVSLFVNPLQFGKNEDLSRYPRNEQLDAEMAESVGVDYLLCPTPEEFLLDPRATVTVSEVTERYEGAVRPGHFAGVATIVLKLFQVCKGSKAYFGLKDRQQCAVISAMVSSLNLPIELSFVPTRRESDGLAMSSRNVYLSAEDRKKAVILPTQLREVGKEMMANLSSNAAPFLQKAVAVFESNDIKVDYFDLVDPGTFLPMSKIHMDGALIAAIRIGNTRLIDNVDIDIATKV